MIRKRGGWASKIAGGIHSAGLPDVIAVYKRYPLHLEGKMPGKEKNLTPLQSENLKKAKEAGAITMVYTNVDQVRKLLDRIDNRKKT